MKQSLFIEYVSKWFIALAKGFTEKLNGADGQPKYLFMRMLKKEYSTDLKWNSASISKSIVAADVVSMDSELPLKRRDSLSAASGEIPKIGMKFYKGEKTISDLNIMRARGATEAQVAQKLFDDTEKVIAGVYERNEIMFLQGLSTGYTAVPDEENTGIAVRVDYGYHADNKIQASVNWGATGYKPLTDITEVIEKADAKGVVFTTIQLDRAAYNEIRRSEEAKQLYATFANITGKYTGIPTPANFNAAFEDEYGIKFEIIERSVYVEKNGKRTAIKPFAKNTLVFLQDANSVGTLFYGTLAEETNPVEGVKYTKANEYTLVSKYAKNDPLREFTSSQALVLPVIDSVDKIFLLHTKKEEEAPAPDSTTT